MLPGSRKRLRQTLTFLAGTSPRGPTQVLNDLGALSARHQFVSRTQALESDVYFARRQPHFSLHRQRPVSAYLALVTISATGQ